MTCLASPQALNPAPEARVHVALTSGFVAPRSTSCTRLFYTSPTYTVYDEADMRETSYAELAGKWIAVTYETDPVGVAAIAYLPGETDPYIGLGRTRGAAADDLQRQYRGHRAQLGGPLAAWSDLASPTC